MQSLKHVGRMKSTNKKVLVAYRTLPGDAYSCLVVATESLDDQFHNAIINLVESPAAQEAYEFAEALDRTQFPDGSRMLPALHSRGRLIKAQTSQVEMTPTIGVSILLSELNQIIAEQRGVAIDGLCISPSSNDKAEIKELARVQEATNTAKTTSASINEAEQTAVVNMTPEEQAKDYRSKADKLAKEAAAFRRMAEELVPTKKKSTEEA
jgi:hypothetical protein